MIIPKIILYRKDVYVMFCTIYMHRNKINHKVYIGETCQLKLNDRWKNGAGYKTCSSFYNAIQKYGWDNFEHLILEQGDWTSETIAKKENYYINLYDAKNPEKGYNINDGYYQSVSPKANEAAVKWMKQHPDFGLARAQDMLKWQKEHPEEMRKIRQENISKATNARKRKVQCIETGVIYESASEAARKNPNTTQSKICMVCQGKRKTCGKLHWRYINE